jgi:hypothetical protein
VVLLTPGGNQSPDVLQEVQRAHEERKLIVPVIVDNLQPSDDLIYFLRVRQQLAWTDARAVAAEVAAVFATGAEELRQTEARRQAEAAAASEAEKRREARVSFRGE